MAEGEHVPPSAGTYRAAKPLVDLIPPDRRRRNALVLASASMAAGVVLAVLAQQLYATIQIRDRSDAAVVTVNTVPAPAIASLAVARPREWVDRTSRADGPIRPDGNVDARFDVELEGAFVALALAATDANGRPLGLQQWDTFAGDQLIARSSSRGFGSSKATWQLGVFRDGVAMLNERGVLAPLPDGHQSLQLYASDTGLFRAGTHFRVFGVLADGTVVESPVATYPTGQDLSPSTPPVPASPAPPGAFDRAAASAALASVELNPCQIRLLATAPARAQPTGHVTITFSPDGTVSAAEVDDGPLVDNPIGACVAARYRKVVVPAFTGAPVRVGKSFAIERVDHVDRLDADEL